ncbi:MAG: hypothetical protein AB7S69_11950 [Salinivirgaceae bacterium]
MKEKTEDLMALNAIQIGEWIEPRFKKLEMLFIAIAVVGLVLFFTSTDQNNFILTIGFLVLSTLYFFRGFSPIKIFAEQGVDNFMKYIGYWGISMLVVGIFFRISSYPGWNVMLVTGNFVLFIFIGFGLYWTKKHEKMKDLYKPIIYRALILLFIGLLMNFTPSEKLLEIGFIKKTEMAEPIE